MEEKKLFTWQELSQLSQVHNAHVAYAGKVYDVSGFVKKHPGGCEQVMLGAGHDITQLFHGYHKPQTAKVIKEKCRYVGDLTDHERTVFPHDEGEFYHTLQQRVANYFRSNGLDPKVDPHAFCCYALYSFLAIFLWYVCIAMNASWPQWSVLVAAAAGFFTAMVAITFAHDSNHFAITHKSWVWTACSFIASCILGMSSLAWRYQHTYGHHICTNIDESDPDLFTVSKGHDFRRIKRRQSWFPAYRLQHIYLPIVYSFVGLKMKLEDFHTFYVMKKDTARINPLTTSQSLMLISEKAVHIVIRYLLPYFYVPLSTLLVLNIVTDLVMGLWIGTITQLSHINTRVGCPPQDPKKKSEQHWAEVQLASTVDYATNSWFWTMITGGVNHHVSHHLFPSIPHTYLPLITPIITRTCAEFGIQYYSLPTFWDAIRHHVRYLSMMGTNPKGSNTPEG